MTSTLPSSSMMPGIGRKLGRMAADRAKPTVPASFTIRRSGYHIVHDLAAQIWPDKSARTVENNQGDSWGNWM
jgi:hypothetical protein